MSIIATALKHLIAAGVSGDDLVRAVAEMEAAQPVTVDRVAEKRRTYDRERKRAARAVSTGIPPDSADPLPPKDNIQNPHPETGSSEPVKTTRAAKAHKLPVDWEPILTADALRKVDGWPPGRFDEVLAAFRDHAADKGRTSKDWQAAFRTWISNENRWKPANGRSQLRPANDLTGLRGSRPDPALDMLYQAQRELQAEAEREDQGSDWQARLALPPH